MRIIDAISLGILQGLTEFLPVSSSGHLAVGQKLLGYKATELILFDVIVHLGTLAAILWVYRSSLVQYVNGSRKVLLGGGEGSMTSRFWGESSMREVSWIVLATIPTGIIGVVFRKPLTAMFDSMSAIACFFAVTGVLLWVTRWALGGAKDIASLSWYHPLILGVAQGIAILPGISRSGTTIAVALLLGMRRDESARISFLMAIPAIAGATILELRKLDGIPQDWLAILIGGLAAVVSGYLALLFLIRLVKQGQLSWFSIYLWLLAGGILLKVHVLA